MRRLRRTPLATTAAALAFALTAAACSSGDDDTDGSAADESAGAEESEAPQGGELSVYLTNPQFLAPPSNVTESEGAEVISAVYSPLVDFDLESGEAVFGDEAQDTTAADIQTEDNQTFTITLKEGWTFHDGEPVTAQSYVDAWNYGANGENAATGSYFFAGIEGFGDLQCQDDNPDDDDTCPTPPTATELSGLEVVDDTTFTVTLSEPNLFFPLLLNYSAFYPLPTSFFDDPEAFNDRPIGQGPFMVDEEGWVRDQQIRVERFEDYPGTQPNVDSIEFRIYAELDAGYNDALAGNLDVMDNVPAAQLDAAATEFGDNFIDQESSSIQFIGFPIYDERFADPNLRKAFSLAVDRQAIADAIRPDFAPLGGYVPPSIPGAVETDCDGFCPATADPEQAQQLLEEAGGWEGPLTLYFNSGADHDAWMEAVANQLRDNLGIQDITFQSLQFAEYLPILEGKQAEGPYRLGWIPDYPNANTYLESLHVTDQSSNYTGYSNPDFDALITEAKSAESIEDSLPLFEEAQGLLHEDMPWMPMFVARQVGVAGERVSGFEIEFDDSINVFTIAVTE